MQLDTIQSEILFDNTGLTELEKAWKVHGQLDSKTLMEITEQNFQNKVYAVALFLANKILKEKNPDENMLVRLRFIRAEANYEFRFYRQAYPDYQFYVKKMGSTPELEQKIRYCRRMVHTGNNGSLLFIAVFWFCTVIMYWALFKIQENYPQDFQMGLNLSYVYYAGAAGLAMLLFGLFYRYVVIARMK